MAIRFFLLLPLHLMARPVFDPGFADTVTDI